MENRIIIGLSALFRASLAILPPVSQGFDDLRKKSGIGDSMVSSSPEDNRKVIFSA